MTKTAQKLVESSQKVFMSLTMNFFVQFKEMHMLFIF